MSHESIKYGVTLVFFVLAYAAVCINIIYTIIHVVCCSIVSVLDYKTLKTKEVFDKGSKEEFKKNATALIFSVFALLIQIISVLIFKSSSILSIIMLIFLNIIGFYFRIVSIVILKG